MNKEQKIPRYSAHYNESFAGDKKVGRSILTGLENRLKKILIPRIPKAIETYHLTLMTILWSAINVCLALYVGSNLNLLWGVSSMIVLQYLTDLLDGELGRQRKTGLIKWGFYMDHFLDYIFLCSLVFVGYMVSPAGTQIWYFALLAIVSGFMVNSFLLFGVTNQFEIYHCGIGPTEMRVIFILINTFIIRFGTGYFDLLIPLTVLICLTGLIVQSCQIHKRLWLDDMAAKNTNQTFLH